MTFEEHTEIATFLRKYAAAVESDLYMRMKTEQASREIERANKLASIVEKEASRLDTIIPMDLG